MALEARRVPLRCEPIVRLSEDGLTLRAVEMLAGSITFNRFAGQDRLLDLDTAVARAAKDLALPPNIAVHLNLPDLGDGRALHSTDYLDAISDLVWQRPVILEISETTTAAGFVEAFQIASITGADLVVDDLAPGNSGWHWLQGDVLDVLPRPDVFPLPFGGKVDWTWFQSCTEDQARWDRFCDHLQRLDFALATLTIEGVERIDHLNRLRRLCTKGAHIDIQGFLLNDRFSEVRRACDRLAHFTPA